MYDVDKAVAFLDAHAAPSSQGRCAQYVRMAIQAGGVTLVPTGAAKDYGERLLDAGFSTVSTGERAQAGDVAVIQPVPGHPYGHMTMFDGTLWVSDFKQLNGLYPGASYRRMKPSYLIYRY